MTDVWLGAIAAATLAMAIVQVGAIVYAARLGRRLERRIEELEVQLSPLLERLAVMTTDAARAAALAVAQIERADALFADFARRAEQTMAVVQQAIVSPAREWLAILSGVRAGVSALGSLRRSGRSHTAEEDDALFIG